MATKQTTNLTRLPVVQNAKGIILQTYAKTLKELAKMPEVFPYRKSTEQILKERTAIIEKESDIYQIEKKVGSGQIEELVIQAKNELSLARKFLVWKPWEPLQTPTPKNQWKWPMK